MIIEKEKEMEPLRVSFAITPHGPDPISRSDPSEAF